MWLYDQYGMGGELAERIRGAFDESRLFKRGNFVKALTSQIAGDLERAFNKYLEDAIECERNGKSLFAALSYAAAALCLKQLGNGEGAVKYYDLALKLLKNGYDAKCLSDRWSMIKNLLGR